MRDSLAELYAKAKQNALGKEFTCSRERNMYVADYLINNGVTVQEWISVKDRLPDKQGNYLTYDMRYRDIEIYYYMGCGEWDHHRNGITDAEGHGFTHWMPLPQPPKGE